MKRLLIPFAVVGSLLALGAIAADVNTGTSSNYSQPIGVRDTAGKVYSLRGTDAGIPYVQPAPGHWDCDGTPVGICTSTGPTNYGNLSSAGMAGQYIIGYCTSAAYVGVTSTMVLTDGGNPPSCASQDGGTIYNEACAPVSANGKFFIDMRDTTHNAFGCVSVSGTAVCPAKVCSN